MWKQIPRRYRWFTAVGVITLVLDQITKYWARNDLPVGPHGHGLPVAVIENFFDWRLSWNTGSAFGLFSGVGGARIFLTLVGLIALGAIVWMVVKGRDDQRRLMVGLGLVGGGAIGNVIDRIIFGKVTDFIVWKWYEHEWPTFNIADAALCVGVGLLFLDLGKQAKEEKQAARARGGKEAKAAKAAAKAGAKK
ncbi:MAG TPA: signal peptidase II [Kofleriaceae bacterium]|nr:signal peptidase II [Kofleriaceae bacterium]